MFTSLRDMETQHSCCVPRNIMSNNVSATMCPRLPCRALSNHDDNGNKNVTKFAYLTMKNNRFARFARAFFFHKHFADVLVLSTTSNDLFCSCVNDVSICWQMFNFVFLSLKRWFQFNSSIVRTHFASIMTMNNWEMMAETRSYILRRRSHCSRRRVCLSSLLFIGGRLPLSLPKRQSTQQSLSRLD